MARSTGINSTDTSARKKLTKPVLPALPLVINAKKRPNPPKEEEKSSVLKSEPALSPVVHAQAEQETKATVPTAQLNIEEPSPNHTSTTHSEPDTTIGADSEVSTHETVSENTIGSDENGKFDLTTPSTETHELDKPQVIQVLPENTAATVTFPSSEIPQISSALDERLPLTSLSLVDNSLIPASEIEGVFPSDQDDNELSAHQPAAASPVNKHQNETPPSETSKVDERAPMSIAAANARLPSESTATATNSSTALHLERSLVSASNIQQTPIHPSGLPALPESVRPPPSRVAVNGVSYNHPQPYVNGHVSSPSNGAAGSPSGPSNFPTILEHIHRILYSQEGADCEVCVYLPQESKPTIFRNSHSFVLIRSARIRNIIHQQRANGYSYYCVNLYPPRAMDANAFDAALRFFYDDTVLSENFLRPDMLVDKASRAGAFDYIMSYMIAGLELGIEPVVAQSLVFVARLLNWDIAELAVRSASALRSASTPAVNPHAPQDAFYAAKTIINHVFDLIVHDMDMKNFRLDVEAVPLELTSRLAPFEGGRGAVNPALAKMVFGSMPASSNMSPTSSATKVTPATMRAETIASSIMLNAEFEDLLDLTQWLKKTHGGDGLRVINEVIQERERRRLSILTNRSTGNKQRMANSTAWDVIGLREYVNEDALRRERVGFLLPGKRGGHH